MYIVNFSVHQFECCGFNSPEDWKNATYFNSSSAVPISCCVDMTVNDCNKVINNSTMYTQVSHLVNQTSIKSNTRTDYCCFIGIQENKFSRIFVKIAISWTRKFMANDSMK